MVLNSNKFPKCPICYTRHNVYPQKCFVSINVFDVTMPLVHIEYIKFWRDYERNYEKI